MSLSCAPLFFAALWTLCMTASLSGTTEMLHLNEGSMEAEMSNSSNTSVSGARRKRAISSNEITALLDYHNLVRSQVSPPAANMEYMVWDETLAASAESWASQCKWDRGPDTVLQSNGQNMCLFSRRYVSIVDMVKPWYDEIQYFSFPSSCIGSVCTHYTQMVWATSNELGCAVASCSNMAILGTTWKHATLLVCNYSIKGNVGEPPYKAGMPCTACSSSYDHSCNNYLCYSEMLTLHI